MPPISDWWFLTSEGKRNGKWYKSYAFWYGKKLPIAQKEYYKK